MASQLPPQKGTAYTFYISLVSQSDTDVFKTSVTLADGDVKVSKDGGSFSNITTLPTEIGTTGVLAVSLSATEMNADRVVVLFHDAAGDEWQDAMVCIDTASQLIDELSALTAADVNAECDTALADYDPPTKTEMDAGFAAVPAAVWGHTPRRLTMTAAEVQAAVADGATLVIHRGDTWTATLTGLGNISGREKLWFTLKSSVIVPDSDALVQITESDGLVRLNGQAGTAVWGRLTVDDEESGVVTIELSAQATAELSPAAGLRYDLQVKLPSGIVTLTQANAVVEADVTRAVS